MLGWKDSAVQGGHITHPFTCLKIPAQNDTKTAFSTFAAGLAQYVLEEIHFLSPHSGKDLLLCRETFLEASYLKNCLWGNKEQSHRCELQRANVFLGHDCDISWLQKCNKAFPPSTKQLKKRKVGEKEGKPAGVFTHSLSWLAQTCQETYGSHNQ